MVLSPVYSGWNFGHELSTILMVFLAFQTAIGNSGRLDFHPDDLILGVSKQSLANSPNSQAVLRQLFPPNRIVDLKKGNAYHLARAIEPPSSFFHLHREDLLRPVFSFLISIANSNPLIKALCAQRILDSDGHFVLCKRAGHSAVRKQGIMPLWVEEKLRLDHWCIIDPERLSLFEIIFLLQHAKSVLMGSGSIQYAHKMFVNREANIYLLFDGPNYPAYSGQKQTSVGIPEHDWNNDSCWDHLLDHLLKP
jgi:hypothetical protein